MMSLISEEDFPFTREELRAALALAYPVDEAERLAAHVASITLLEEKPVEAPPSPSARGKHVASDRSRLVVPSFYLALVAISSTELAERCEAWRRRVRGAGRAARERVAMRAAGLVPGTSLPLEISLQLDAEDTRSDRDWEHLCVQARAYVAQRAHDGP